MDTVDFIADKTFGKDAVLAKAEYDKCTFEHCDFSQKNLRGWRFSKCTFFNCNFAMADVNHTGFREVSFRDCKILGLRFDRCDAFLFSVQFENCLLNLSSFYGRSMRQTKFINCSMQETDLREANLTQAQLLNCDLAGALFDRTILDKADLRSAHNYAIDPASNSMKKTYVSLTGLPGLLAQYDLNISY
jgi:uncharacterized protein YjbI with pentapeptide repeats